MRILYITDSFPYPPVSGDRIRVYNLIRRVAEQNDVWLAALCETPEESEGIKHMQEFCAGVITIPMIRRHPIAHLPGLLQYALAGRPLELKFNISLELVCRIKSLIAQVDFDLIEIQPSYLSLYSELLGLDRHCKRILTFHNIAADQYNQIASLQTSLLKKLRARLFSISLRRWEPRSAEHFDTCITMSQADRMRLLSLNPSIHIEVVPNGVDCRQYVPLQPPQGPPVLLFIGSMNYAPCADAAIFFCQKILPLIRSKVEDIQVLIVGKDPPPDVSNLNIRGVYVTGRVEDIIPYYQRAKICVVPLRAGGGTRLKILEAMALG